MLVPGFWQTRLQVVPCSWQATRKKPLWPKRGHIPDGGCDPSDSPQRRQHIGTRIDRQYAMAEGRESPRMATGPSRDVDRQPRLQLIDQGNDR